MKAQRASSLAAGAAANAACVNHHHPDELHPMHCEILVSALLLVAGQAATSTAPATAPPPPKTADSLELQYARAKLQLAETNLKRVEQINRRMPRSVPSSDVDEFKNDVREAQQQVSEATAGRESGEFGVWLRRAQSDMQSATTRWKNAVAANERLRNSKSAKEIFDALDVERFRLRAEVTRLQWERGKTLVGAARDVQLAWQVELLNNEIDRLKEDASRVSPFIRYYPIYWFPY
jgi:hypothetical protein